MLDKDILVREFIRVTDIGIFFALPLLPQPYEELHGLHTIIVGIVLDESKIDVQKFAWNSDIYSLARIYKFIF